MAFLKKAKTKEPELLDPASCNPLRDEEQCELRRRAEERAARAHALEDEEQALGDSEEHAAQNAFLSAAAALAEGIGDPKEVERLKRAREDARDAKGVRGHRIGTAQAAAAAASAAQRQHLVESAYPKALGRGEAALVADAHAVYGLLLQLQRRVRHAQKIVRALGDAKLGVERAGVVVPGFEGRLASLFTPTPWDGVGFAALAVEDADSNAIDHGAFNTWKRVARSVGIELDDEDAE